jgi:regulation of enolase protein 1 (concanavalin A-like superfamily)
VLFGGAGPVQGPGPIAGWGDPLDPDKDCAIGLEEKVLVVGVPAAPHELKGRPGRRNAPRVMKDAEGNWTAQVQVGGTIDAADGASEGARGAGFLLWLDDVNFVRFERASLGDGAGGARRRVVLLEYTKDGRPVERSGAVAEVPGDGAATWLRLTRRLDKLKAEFSVDGESWTEVKTIPIRLSSRLRLGVLSTNLSGAPLEARFDGLQRKSISLSN